MDRVRRPYFEIWHVWLKWNEWGERRLVLWWGTRRRASGYVMTNEDAAHLALAAMGVADKADKLEPLPELVDPDGELLEP